MTENPYASLEQAIVAAVAELRSLRRQRGALQARVDQLEKQLTVRADGADSAASPIGSADVVVGAPSERLQQLEIERQAIKTRLLRLQSRLGYLGSAEPEERHDDHR
jgi:chromosome segregation ATPase